MIENNSLSDKLNEFKNDPIIPETNDSNGNIKHILSLGNSLINLTILFIKSFVFGYGLKTILNTDWNFLGYLSIGLAIGFLMEFIIDLISYLPSKK